ncbi:Wzz/FepE/Etk N-terminal domain-containing protein [Edaphobacter sp. 12200R-103]|jgi:polysaccharide chain length determinant protein (PEP-CTERM system associated)|uniref:GumC family protein n=1 Tax=Edaphobacter sp. 12200R-103 TaxID=2703788 RepID=UPI00138CE8A3|nr:Wzz/FepE/Etk N-terminal domain-containing protein [Edaphobacter sp. 12200R-103]QHS52240.1 lipopolysaccharide biosynthesis protein [Edaphobacter sp. 12200R-103]
MLGHRTLNVDDYLGILKRRGWIIAAPAVLLALVGFVLTFIVPPRYVSQTLILVEQQKVPDDYVRPVVVEDITARLASMKEQILSRSRLEPIIERFNLYGTRKMSMDDRIDEVRKNIDIKPIHSEMARTGGLPGFFISYKDSDPHTAQQVCGEIASLFVTANLNARAQTVEGTTEFLKSQLADAKRALDEQDAKLAAFQSKYLGRLPGEETPNINMLTSLNTQLDAATQALNRMEQDKSYTESMIAQQQGMSPTGSGDHSSASPSALQSQLQTLENEEADLTRRYTDSYPDVVSVRRRIKDLQAKIAAEPAAPATPATASSTPSRNDSPAVQQLRAQLRSLDQGIQSKRHDQALLSSQIRMYQDRISSSPMVLEEYKSITRDYQTAQAFYDDLLKKMNQSKMATDLERRQQGEQFSVMDQPNLPDSPTFPKRGVFIGAGFVAGLFLGTILVAWREYRDTVMRSERDVWAFTKLPTLGVISFSSNDPDQPPPGRRWGLGRRRSELQAGKPLVNTGE